MPIVHVRGPEIVPDHAEALLNELARAVASGVSCDVHDVWCTYDAVIAQTVGGHLGRIAYVELLQRDTAVAAVRGGLEAAARVVAEGLGIPREDVWARFTPVRSGEVYAGGRILSW